MWKGIQLTLCVFQQHESTTNVRSSMLSEVTGSLGESNTSIIQNVSKEDKQKLILKDSAKINRI